MVLSMETLGRPKEHPYILSDLAGLTDLLTRWAELSAQVDSEIAAEEPSQTVIFPNIQPLPDPKIEALPPYIPPTPTEYRQLVQSKEAQAYQDLLAIVPLLFSAAQQAALGGQTDLFPELGHRVSFDTRTIDSNRVDLTFRQDLIAHTLRIELDANQTPHFSLYKTRYSPAQRYTRRIDFLNRVPHKYITLIEQLTSLALHENSQASFLQFIHRLFFNAYESYFAQNSQVSLPSEPDSETQTTISFETISPSSRQIVYTETQLGQETRNITFILLYSPGQVGGLTISDQQTNSRSNLFGSSEIVTHRYYDLLLNEKRPDSNEAIANQDHVWRYLLELDELLATLSSAPSAN